MQKEKSINNEFYDTLNAQWLTAEDHPIALLRAENKIRNPWILKTIEDEKKGSLSILDIGCGAGFLSNYLAEKGHFVTGIDLSEKSLEIAKKKKTGATYILANALSLPFQDASFDVISAMDLLEHVENPSKVIEEASRVLKPNGLFFFHTFNRNLLSYLLIIKGVDWFVKNAPKDMHVYSLFIKPEELKSMMQKQELSLGSIQGLVPDPFSKGFWRMLSQKVVKDDFRFKFAKNLQTGYIGWARKHSP